MDLDLDSTGYTEKNADWPWPHYPRKAERNYFREKNDLFTGWEGDFLASYRDNGIMRAACKAATISQNTIVRRRKRDPEFEAAFKEAQLMAVEVLEGAAWHRAVNGTLQQEDVYYKGAVVGQRNVRQYSDTLLIFLLKGNAPQKYRESIEHNHNVKVAEDEARKMARANGLDEEEVVAETMRILNGQV